MTTTADVLVIGAGIAGSVAAADLARRGVSVLLASQADDDAGHPGHGYDLLVTGQARLALAGAGLSELAPLRDVELVELRFGGSVVRAIPDSGAAVTDSRDLTLALRDAAASAGAAFIRGTARSLSYYDGTWHAVIECAAAQRHVTVRHVVLAAGCGSSRIAPSAVPDASGIICARRYAGLSLGSTAVLALPAPTGPAYRGQLMCVWALPGRDRTITVGAVHFVDSGEQASADDLQVAALRGLAQSQQEFRWLRPVGELHSGPLHAGFTPARVAKAGVLLTGDAAGLVNPFSGEGLGAAVHSGLLAARLIASNVPRPVVVCSKYARQLAATYVGAFETSRHAAHRYQLTWRILAAGAGSDHPFFAKGRRVLLLPHGRSGLSSGARLSLTDPDAALLGPFLAACDEVAISVVRGEWPFVARLALADDGLGQPWIRPTVVLYGALASTGSTPPVAHAALGAAVELAFLGAISLFGSATRTAANRGIDWSAAATIVVGDFVLAQASRLVADHCPELSWSFADWLAELAALRAGQLESRGYVPAVALYGSLLEFPARIGAHLAGAPPETARAIREFGYHAGQAFLHAEDVLAVSGMRTRLDTTLDAMMYHRLSAVPDRLDGKPVSGAALAEDEELRLAILADAAAARDAARKRALDALSGITSPVAGRILRKCMASMTEPACLATE